LMLIRDDTMISGSNTLKMVKNSVLRH
jgi:hypothetical protein